MNTTSFTLKLSRSGIETEVPEDKSIVDVLNELSVDIETSCLDGVCGTCVQTVIRGEIEHNDCCLFDDEKDQGDKIACCVSRGKPGTALELDL